MGSAINPPTLRGISVLLEHVVKFERQFNIVVAGYGVDIFENYASKNIKIFSNVPSDTLDELIKNSKALIVYQVISSGILTKVIEFQHLEIPIFGNNCALRGIDLNNSTIMYKDFDELEALMTKMDLEYF
jgi:hypothetical protein